MDNPTTTETKQTDAQKKLAQHLEALHLDITKLCMEKWMQLAKGEFNPEKSLQVISTFHEMRNRIVLAENCCWQIQFENNNPSELLKGEWIDDETSNPIEFKKQTDIN